MSVLKTSQLAITVPNDGMDVDDSGDAGVDVTKEGQQVQEFGLELDYADIDEAEKEVSRSDLYALRGS